MIITAQYLRENPNHIFVFGDNTVRRGKGGAAKFRGYPNTYGFITKKYPNNYDSSFYRPDEYKTIFKKELHKLKEELHLNSHKQFLISALGAGLANKYDIWNLIIKPALLELNDTFSNVTLLWE